MEFSLLQVDLRYVDCLRLADCVCDDVLSDVRSFSYADELSEAACVVIGVYATVKDYIDPIA